MKRIFTYLLLFLFAGILSPDVSADSDSSMVMRFPDFMQIVRMHHPIGRQAELQRRQGDAVLRESRGGFDPKLMLSTEQKQFDGKNYYDLLEGGLKVPTWFGLELNGGYEQSRGLFLNPEESTPGAGLVYAGVGIPIGQGLFIDKRRAELRKAQVFQESTEAMRLSIYNQLLYDASKAYWEWFMAYHVMQVYDSALIVASQRFEAVKTSAFLGDRPSIDTLESGIQVQNRRLTLQQSELDYQNASALLQVYLWRDGEIPLELDENIKPPQMDSLDRSPISPWETSLVDSLLAVHPDLLQYQYKIEQLDIERRWKQEQIKPVLDLKYNFLAEPVSNDPVSQFTPNNYKWGLEFEFPILLRKERGALLLNRTKVEQAKFDYSLKYADLNFKWKAARNEFNTTENQIELYSRTVRDYAGLLAGERTLFRGGESSLFLVNSRELGYINAQIKLIELLSKNQKARIAAVYSLGILHEIDF